jgi:membrane protein insertase Oxa1/YidC/SpoIIIJ
LALYWIVSSLFGVWQQLYARKKYPVKIRGEEDGDEKGDAKDDAKGERKDSESEPEKKTRTLFGGDS